MQKCHTIHRADHILEDYLKETFEGLTPEELTELIKTHKIRCPKCKGELETAGILNLMFPITLGTETKSYLRPETAQGVYVNFSRMFEVTRKQLPLGLAIIGKAYRNEISPRQLLIRMREFTQAELQIFFDPSRINEHENWGEVKNYKLLMLPASNRKEIIELTCEDVVKKLKLPKFYVYHLAKTQQFFLDKLKIDKKSFRFKELSEEEKAFYNKIHWDIELNLESIGWKEMGGVHYRTDHDLSGHAKVSKKSAEIFFENKKLVPHVLELSFGIDRILFSLLDISFVKEKERSFLRLPASISPFFVAVFPLVNKDGIDEKAKEVYDNLKIKFDVFFDNSGSIGKMYSRADEIGTAFCITCDYDTLKDNSVTVRQRDTKKQDRVKIKDLEKFISNLLE